VTSKNIENRGRLPADNEKKSHNVFLVKYFFVCCSAASHITKTCSISSYQYKATSNANEKKGVNIQY
jgi:hypothetical protein